MKFIKSQTLVYPNTIRKAQNLTPFISNLSAVLSICAPKFLMAVHTRPRVMCGQLESSFTKCFFALQKLDIPFNKAEIFIFILSKW